MIKYMAVAVAVAVSGGVAVPVAVPMATTKNPKRALFSKDSLSVVNEGLKTKVQRSMIDV